MPTPYKPLTIYKASAGSGKTFTLAVEYIKLLIQDPQNYRFILAVTFTNKATEEMKTRILSQLYGISQSLPDSENYMERLREAFPTFHDQAIRERAGEALQLILHNYNYFRVGTIDSFFQSILHNLARELGLTANMQIGLNDIEVEQQAVDNIIENIDRENDPLLGWLMDFVREQMDDQKNWNVIGAVKAFGRNIFEDFYKEHQQDLSKIMSDPNFFKRYTGYLRAMKQQARNDMKQAAEEFQQLLDAHGLQASYFSRGTVPGYFEKLANGDFAGDKFPSDTLLKTIKDPSIMVRKADRNTPEATVMTTIVWDHLKKTDRQRQKAVVTSNTVDLTLGKLNELRLLGRIEQEVKRIHDEGNTYPLSATQKLIKDMIDKEDSPFIYEKIGGQLKFIMIDEFQDTSKLQWDNFKVLLDNCLAQSPGSLIVGDVKQSIYRWRNGDWHLLQGLTTSKDSRIKPKTLKTNYRSKRNIIRFNNAFFQVGARRATIAALTDMDSAKTPSSVLNEALDICRAYVDVKQEVAPKQEKDPEENAGSVTLRLLSTDSTNEDMIPEVQQVLEKLLSAGIPQRKIAVLVRTNGQIAEIAQYFQQNAITVNGKERMVDMVSDEAFRLDASMVVTSIIRAMQLLLNPSDKLLIAALAKAYHKVLHPDDSDADTQLFLQTDAVADGLPKGFLEQTGKLLAMPLIDMAEEIYQRFEFHRIEGQSAYVCAFFDKLANYTQNYIGSLEDFLKEWEENLCGKSIHSAEADGIRLLTIHKSKGLEFDNVIIPYCHWNVEKPDSILWVKPSKPYNELPLVPVALSQKKLRTSIYADQYESEHLKNIVDNLNVLYVAFTRAGRNLFVIGKDGAKQGPSQLMADVINYKGGDPNPLASEQPEAPDYTMPSLLPDHQVETDEDGNITFQLGQLCLSEDKADKDTQNVFEQKEKGLAINIRGYEQRATFKQSNASVDFTTPPEEEDEKQQQQQYIETGNILHNLFANIHDVNDVAKAIENMEFDGVLYDKTITREALQHAIATRLQSPQVARWFEPGWQVFNECSILSWDDSEGRVREWRPDRVITNGQETIVIDFKTGREREMYHKQVCDYMALLSQMGHKNIKGYLWYLRPNKVVEVVQP